MILCHYHISQLQSQKLNLLILNHCRREVLVVEDLAKLLPSYLLDIVAPQGRRETISPQIYPCSLIAPLATQTHKS